MIAPSMCQFLLSDLPTGSTHETTCFNDLLPLPYTQATLAQVCEHIDEVQDAIGCRIPDREFLDPCRFRLLDDERDRFHPGDYLVRFERAMHESLAEIVGLRDTSRKVRVWPTLFFDDGVDGLSGWHLRFDGIEEADEGKKQPTKYWLSTLPEGIDFAALVDIAKLRWRIERDYQELKQEVGLGHFEGRGWRGLAGLDDLEKALVDVRIDGLGECHGGCLYSRGHRTARDLGTKRRPSGSEDGQESPHRPCTDNCRSAALCCRACRRSPSFA